jgi:ribulose-phosphate 3-epimerase
MNQVVPAVLEQSLEAIQKKVDIIKAHTNFIQLDVMDNVFVPNETFRDPTQLADLDITMELHLMIEKPSFHVNAWALPNVSRMIVHQEAAINLSQVVKLVKDAGKEIGVAINPSTSTHTLKDVIDDLDLVLVMGVKPGFSGQDFHNDILEKIREVKSMRSDVIVEVDGGVNAQTAPRIVEAGCDILAAASFIWKSNDIAQAITTLQNA